MNRIPATIITGFLGAGKTTLLRHLLQNSPGRRIAVIVNEFGTLGIDADTLRGCGIAGCEDDDIIELANGCLCCMVADDFLPTMERLLERASPPEHIVIETSGLALPAPLLRAFGWPSIRTRVAVDGLVAVIDAEAVADGRFADDPAAIAAQRAADPSIAHDNPLGALFEDQLRFADLIVLNKIDLVDRAARDRVEGEIHVHATRSAKLLRTTEGRVDPAILLGLQSGAVTALDSEDHDDHDHEAFESFVIALPEIGSIEQLTRTLHEIAEGHDVMRIKGFVAVRGKPLRLAVQGVGGRVRHQYDRAWAASEPRIGQLVLIGRSGLARGTIEAMFEHHSAGVA